MSKRQASTTAETTTESSGTDSPIRTCTICLGPFNLDTEGGVEGYIGMLTVAFCVTCKAGIFDFVEEHSPPREEG